MVDMGDWGTSPKGSGDGACGVKPGKLTCGMASISACRDNIERSGLKKPLFRFAVHASRPITDLLRRDKDVSELDFGKPRRVDAGLAAIEGGLSGIGLLDRGVPAYADGGRCD